MQRFISIGENYVWVIVALIA